MEFQLKIEDHVNDIALTWDRKTHTVWPLQKKHILESLGVVVGMGMAVVVGMVVVVPVSEAVEEWTKAKNSLWILPDPFAEYRADQ